MRARRLPQAVALVVLALVAGRGCGEPSAPRPGRLAVELLTTRQDVGAMRLRITGEGIADLAAESEYRLFHRTMAAGQLEAVVVGDVVAGALLTIAVSDVRGAYTATLVEVALRDNSIAPSLDGFAVQVRRP